MAIDFDAHFHAFLADTVNLKPHKLEQLERRVEAITSAFQADPKMGSAYEGYTPQGSWAHQTIIDPVGPYDEFDADILLHLTRNPDWDGDPKRYLQNVRAAFKRTRTYSDKLIRKNRCVRIEYANDCHVDVVPSVTLADGRDVITCYSDNEFEDTNPIGFANWMKERDDITKGQLRRVIRLFKWLRDYKNTFTCPSVIITVLLGESVRPWDLTASYGDLPSALLSLLETLDGRLQANPNMPLIHDPSCPGLNFNHRWRQEQYANFRDWVSYYASVARAAYDRQGSDDEAALKSWQEMFGPEFAATGVIENRAALQAQRFAGGRLAHGTAAAPSPDIAPDEQFITTLYPATMLGQSANIHATVPGSRRSDRLRRIGVVGLHRSLEFRVHTDTPAPYDVLWKVRNRGPEAARVPGGLRGQIFEGGVVHRESTLYKGQHYVEVYIVRDGVVVASDHHEVKIV